MFSRLLFMPFQKTWVCDFISSFWYPLQGVLGIKVKIMLSWDPNGKQGPTTPLPDLVTIHSPKDEEEYVKPTLVATDIEVPIQVA